MHISNVTWNQRFTQNWVQVNQNENRTKWKTNDTVGKNSLSGIFFFIIITFIYLFLWLWFTQIVTIFYHCWPWWTKCQHLHWHCIWIAWTKMTKWNTRSQNKSATKRNKMANGWKAHLPLLLLQDSIFRVSHT